MECSQSPSEPGVGPWRCFAPTPFLLVTDPSTWDSERASHLAKVTEQLAWHSRFLVWESWAPTLSPEGGIAFPKCVLKDTCFLTSAKEPLGTGGFGGLGWLPTHSSHLAAFWPCVPALLLGQGL